MLFTCLEGEDKGALVAIVLGHADDTTWHLTDEFLRAAHIAHVRTTELHRDTQTLSIAHCDIGTPLARCLQDGEIGSHTIHDEESLLLMTSLSKTRQILNNSKDIGLLYHHTSHTSLSETSLQIVKICHTIFQRDGYEFDTLMQGIGIQNLTGLWVQASRHQHLVHLLTCSHCHHHSLSRGCGTIVHGGIRDIHSRELCHHTLILKDIM